MTAVSNPPLRRLQGKVALVTGASRGIGRSIVERFAAEGARVVLLDVSARRTDEAGRELREAGLDVHPYVVDVADRAAVFDAFARIEADLGAPVTVLVNNAVFARYLPLEEVDEASTDRILAVGLKGLLWTTQAALPGMKRAGGGSVIHLSSAAAVLGSPNSTVYCALKAGVSGLTRAMAVELAPHGIRVNAVAPGMIGTPASLAMFDQPNLDAKLARMPMGRFGQPEEIAAAVAFLASDDGSYVQGAVLAADGGVTVAGF